MTAEEYALLDPDQPSELVRGRVVPLTNPVPLHGSRCSRIAYLIESYLEEHDVGHVFSNDAGVITERGPDTVRGVDVAYFSYERLAKDAPLDRYPQTAPDVAFEVLSPSNRRGEIQAKIAEYLAAGSLCVGIIHWRQKRVALHWADDRVENYEIDDTVDLSAVMPGFKFKVREVYKKG